jgi:hypothetical protein
MADNIYGSTWTTSANTQVGSYPYINLTQTEAGHMDMKDDTPGNESMRRQHGTTGTYEHWYHNGDADAVIKGNNFTVIVKDNNVSIRGVCNIEVYQDCKLVVRGDMISEINGSLKASVGGKSHIHTAGRVDLSSDGDINITAGSGDTLTGLGGGTIFLNSPADVVVSGDLRVQGAITATSISSKTNVTAGFKVFATGGLETLGGLNVGLVTPGPIVPPGVITAITSIEAPLAVFGIMGSILMSDVINSSIYDFHCHPAPKGSTGAPYIPFFGV